MFLLLKAVGGWEEREAVRVSALPSVLVGARGLGRGCLRRSITLWLHRKDILLLLQCLQGITVDFCHPLRPVAVGKRSTDVTFLQHSE